MTHKHHVTPKYRGGTDESSNLIEVSVTQHAMFHFCNWVLWGDKRDWLAWKGLIGEIPKQELVRELRKLGGSKGGIKTGQKPETKERMRKLSHLNREKAVAAAASQESNQKRKKSFEKIQHQQGERNSQHGTMWITNGEKNAKIKSGDPMPENYYKGRKV
jgi:carbamoylphosphate synthase small subunit